MIEEWKPVVGYEGIYAVSNFGRVKSLARSYKVGKGFRRVDEKLMNPRKDRSGLRLNLTCADKIIKRFAVHCLVMRAFVGAPPTGKEVCHNDGDCTNNHLDNLRYDTHKANLDDKRIHGTWQSGIRVGTAKLDFEKAKLIRKMHFYGISARQLGRDFGVSKSQIQAVVQGLRWNTPDNL